MTLPGAQNELSWRANRLNQNFLSALRLRLAQRRLLFAAAAVGLLVGGVVVAPALVAQSPGSSSSSSSTSSSSTPESQAVDTTPAPRIAQPEAGGSAFTLETASRCSRWPPR